MKTRIEKIIDWATIFALIFLAGIAIKECKFPRNADAPWFAPEKEKGLPGDTWNFYPDPPKDEKPWTMFQN